MQDQSIDILNGTLQVHEDIKPEDYDDDFSLLITYAQQGNYGELFKNSEEMIAGGIYDIRIIAYLLYGHYTHTDSKDLATYLKCLNKVLSKDIEALKPVEKKELQILKSITWFFDQIARKIDHEETKSVNNGIDDDELPCSIIDDAIRELDAITQTIEPIFQEFESSVPESLIKIKKWYSEVRKVVLMEKEDNVNPEKEGKNESEPEIEKTENNIQDLDTSKYFKLIINEDSHSLKLLLKKLMIFEKLIDKGELTKAAIVRHDIFKDINEFDPKLYFPNLFKKFLALQAENLHELSSYEMEEGNPEWTILEEYYKVDMEGFLDIKV